MRNNGYTADEVMINGMAVEKVEGGQTLEEALVVSRLLAAAAGKILAEKGDEIIRCDECLTCFATIGSGKPMGCKVNRSLPVSARTADCR